MTPPLANVTNLNGSAIGVINGNSDKIENEFDKVLYKDGSVNMDGALDMDSNRIINLPYATSASSPVTLEQFLAEKKGDKGEPGTPGLPGVGGNTFLSLASLKSMDPILYKSAILADGVNPPIAYAYVTGDFTGKADDRYIVKIDSVPLTTGALIRDTSVISVADFGAKGNAVFDDTAAIQAAINFMALQPNGGAVIIPVGTFKLTYRAAEDGAGVTCLSLRDKVELRGMSKYGSILKLANGSIGPGTYGRIIVGTHNVQITQCGISNLTVDGNRSNQGLFANQGNGGNIVINNCRNIAIVDVVSKGANGQGIQIIGGRNTPSEDITIRGCKVSDTAGSTLNNDGSVAVEFNGNGCGIQLSYVTIGIVSNNVVVSTKDNCIDTYGENVDYTTIPPTVFDPTGGALLITDNVLSNGRVGVFPETSARIKVSNNYINAMTEIGVSVNRINSNPRGIEIINNTIDTCPVGVRIGGDCSSNPGVMIKGNLFQGNLGASTIGVLLDKTSYVLVEDNTFAFNNAAIPLVQLSGSSVSFCRVTGNKYYGNPNGGTLFYVTATSTFSVSSDDWISIDNQSYARADNTFSRYNLSAGGTVNFAGLVTYPDSGTAQAGGVPLGGLYKTGDGTVKVRI